MKNSALLVGVLAFALSACGNMHAKGDRGAPATGVPSNTVVVNVAIVGGKIYAPDKTYTYANQDEIVWTINTPGNYTFPDNGIVFQRPGVFICHPHQGGIKTFTCRKNGHQLGEYKYTVNVNDGARPLPPLDPMIFNM